MFRVGEPIKGLPGVPRVIACSTSAGMFEACSTRCAAMLSARSAGSAPRPLLSFSLRRGGSPYHVGRTPLLPLQLAPPPTCARPVHEPSRKGKGERVSATQRERKSAETLPLCVVPLFALPSKSADRLLNRAGSAVCTVIAHPSQRTQFCCSSDDLTNRLTIAHRTPTTHTRRQRSHGTRGDHWESGQSRGPRPVAIASTRCSRADSGAAAHRISQLIFASVCLAVQPHAPLASVHVTPTFR